MSETEDDTDETSTLGTAGIVGYVFLGAVVLCVAVALSSTEFYRVPTSSMTPTLEPGSYVFVSFLDEPEVGDLAFFEFRSKRARTFVQKRGSTDCLPPGGLEEMEGQLFVGRVVAIGGDTVSLEGTRLEVNGETRSGEVVRREQNEGFMTPDRLIVSETLGDVTYRAGYGGDVPRFGPYEVPEDHVFILSDNRTGGTDSRCYGPVPRDLLLGSVFWSI